MNAQMCDTAESKTGPGSVGSATGALDHNHLGKEAGMTRSESTDQQPTVHDLTRRYWGHDISSITDPDSNNEQRVCVFLSARISRGDHILVQGKTSIGTYEVISDVERRMDPGDQHFMRVRRIS